MDVCSLASYSVRLTPGAGAPGTRWMGSWVSHRAGLDAVSKRKIFYPRRESNLDCSARSLVSILTGLSRLLMGICGCKEIFRMEICTKQKNNMAMRPEQLSLLSFIPLYFLSCLIFAESVRCCSRLSVSVA
jgi:hypothetical protein